LARVPLFFGATGDFFFFFFFASSRYGHFSRVSLNYKRY
jgi:hypothetical protein